MTFENIVAKEEIAHNEQFLLIAIMFSTLFNNQTISYRNISHFCPDYFKVVCCRFVVCGKGLKHMRPIPKLIKPLKFQRPFNVKINLKI